MRERLLVLALAAGALALFYILLFPKPSQDSDEGGLPLSSESGTEGYQAVWRWLREEHVPAVSLRNRYDHLAGLLRKPTGNVLIITMPQRVPVRMRELDDLKAWVARGNTLLILAAIEDTPLWMLGADPLFEDPLEALTGLRFVSPKKTRGAGLASLTQTTFDIQPRGRHPLTTGVRHVTALTTLPARRARLRSGLESIPLELAARSETNDTTFWLTRRGAGQAILSTAASPFSNGAIALTDNAQLLANVLAWSLAPGGSVVFDDAHQGLTDYYDGKAFFADSRLHHTLEWIILLWAVLVLGALPLQAARPSWQPLDETAYVEASARYFAAVVPSSAAARRLIEEFLDRLARQVCTERPASRFEILDAHAGVSRGESEALHELYERACAGEPIGLVRLQNLLSQLRRIFE
ncbi:MAG TPA: DUF4350 domain-containing protein [Steroidobacteraceae bacterium]|jgi:hypothetical protein